MRKTIIFLLLLTLNAGFLSAQEPSISIDQFNITPRSPEASSLINFIDAPVNTYNGRASINIPLGQVTGYGIGDQVSINYQTGGIPVKSVASHAGLGWSLDYGGTITRKVNGLPDEFSYPDLDVKGFLHLREEYSFEDLNSPNWNYDFPSSPANAIYDKLAFGCYDAEPDEFYFKIGPYSGKFAFDWEGGDPIVSSEFDVKVERVTSLLSVDHWILTAPDGVIYEFHPEDAEITDSRSDVTQVGCSVATSRMSYISTWNLTRKTGVQGSTIEYSYEDYRFQQHWTGGDQIIYPIAYGQEICGGASPKRTFGTLSSSIINGKRIRRIESNEGDYIQFYANTPRNDIEGLLLYTSFNQLDQIEIGRKSFLAKKINFNYFENSDRPLLKSIEEVGSDGTSLPPHTFEYFSTNFPPINSNAIDFWGFHNGSSGSFGLIPAGIFRTVYGNYLSHEGRDRKAYLEPTLDSHLESYTSPLGGKQTFDFELNEYSYINGSEVIDLKETDFTLAQVSSGAIGNVNQQGVYQQDIEYFSLDEDQVVTFNISGEVYFTCFNGLPKAYIEYADGSPIDEIAQTYVLNPNINPDGDPMVNPDPWIFELPAGDYRIRTAAMSCTNEVNRIFASLTYYVPDTTYLLKKTTGGVRIAATHTFEPTSGKTISKYYKYNGEEPGTSNGVVYAEPEYIYSTTRLAPEHASNGPIQQIIRLTPCNSVTYTGNSRYLQSSTSGWHVGYKKVEEWNGPNKENGHSAFEYQTPNDFPDIINFSIPFGAPLSNSFQTGLLRKSLTYSAAGQLLKETNYAYEYKTRDFDCLKIGHKMPVSSNEDYQGFQHLRLLALDILEFYGRWGSPIAPMRFGYAKLTTTSDQSFQEDGNSTIATTNKTFDDKLQNLKSEAVSGPGGGKTFSYRYAQDIGDQVLINRHMVSIPLETFQGSANDKVIGQKVEYSGFTSDPNIEQGYSPQANCLSCRVSPYKYYVWEGEWKESLRIEAINSESRPLAVKRRGFEDAEFFTWEDGLLIGKEFIDYSESWLYEGDSRLMSNYTAIDGQSIEYDYDGLQRLKTVTARNGAVETNYNYQIGSQGNKITQTTTYTEGDPSQTSESNFDGLGRPTTTIVNGIIKESVVYDDYGRVSERLYMPGYGITSITYDNSPLNRIKIEDNPGPGAVEYHYLVDIDGHPQIEVKDEKGNLSLTSTDVFGRTVRQENALGGVTRYKYTSFDAPSEIQPPIGAWYKYSYDDRNRLESKTIPGGGTTKYHYDDANRLKATQLANGNLISVAYDEYA
ncbi:MAG: hypothetical protein AAF705_00585, partial [Bacteroidota bacterium]